MLAISYGMDEKEAEETISEMINGTVSTLFNSNLTPEEVMDLVPVKPIGEYEETIKSFYLAKLNAIYEKIKS
jgi:pyrroline-5-carboxylate reductase